MCLQHDCFPTPKRIVAPKLCVCLLALAPTSLFLRIRTEKISELEARLTRLDDLYHQNTEPKLLNEGTRPSFTNRYELVKTNMSAGAIGTDAQGGMPISSAGQGAGSAVQASPTERATTTSVTFEHRETSSAFDCCALCIRKGWCRSWMWRDVDALGPKGVSTAPCQLHNSIRKGASGSFAEVPKYPPLAHRPTALACHMCPNSQQANAQPGTPGKIFTGCVADNTIRHLTIAIPTVARDEFGANTYLNRTVSRLVDEISANNNAEYNCSFHSVSLLVFSHSAEHASFDKLRVRLTRMVEQFGIPNLSAISFLSDGNLLSRLDPHRRASRQFGGQGSANVYPRPGERVRQQGVDFLALLRAVIAESAAYGSNGETSVLLTEDDMLPCPGTLNSIARLTSQLGRWLPSNSANGRRWMLRSGGGLAGAVLPLSALPDLYDFMSKYNIHRPNDHLIFEWGVGRWETEDNFRAGVKLEDAQLPVAVFRTRQNMWEHVGHQSSLGHSMQRGILQCGRRLEDASCYETFHQQCEVFGLELSPCTFEIFS
eukprot:COSAG05_NODE_325_length_11376_cov_31.743726_1_plen_543_part_00